MPTNDFLPFGNAVGANVMSQADYLALATRSTGFSSGTAKSAQLNKAWRQSSLMSAVLAQLIVDTTGKDAIDDGTTATLLANLKASIKAQPSGIVGSVRNLKCSVAATSASATITADEIIVESALGGFRYCLSSFNKTINLGGTGAGGMDTGTATANGFVGIHAIYNPTTQVSALLATMEASAVLPSVYGGGNMPAGYTASALISVAPISATAGQFAAFFQVDRSVDYLGVGVLTSSTAVGGPFARSSTGFPYTAKFVSGFNQAGSSATSSVSQTLTSVPNSAIGGQFNTATLPGGSVAVPFRVAISVPQTIYQTAGSTGGTPSFTISVKNYEF